MIIFCFLFKFSANTLALLCKLINRTRKATLPPHQHCYYLHQNVQP